MSLISEGFIPTSLSLCVTPEPASISKFVPWYETNVLGPYLMWLGLGQPVPSNIILFNGLHFH